MKKDQDIFQAASHEVLFWGKVTADMITGRWQKLALLIKRTPDALENKVLALLNRLQVDSRYTATKNKV